MRFHDWHADPEDCNHAGNNCCRECCEKKRWYEEGS